VTAKHPTENVNKKKPQKDKKQMNKW